MQRIIMMKVNTKLDSSHWKKSYKYFALIIKPEQLVKAKNKKRFKNMILL